jgi:hypothetical protein
MATAFKIALIHVGCYSTDFAPAGFDAGLNSLEALRRIAIGLRAPSAQSFLAALASSKTPLFIDDVTLRSLDSGTMRLEEAGDVARIQGELTDAPDGAGAVRIVVSVPTSHWMVRPAPSGPLARAFEEAALLLPRSFVGINLWALTACLIAALTAVFVFLQRKP